MIEQKIIVDGGTATKALTLNGDINTTTFEVSGRISASGDVEIYDGEYLVIPKTEEQKLRTKKKLMADDVTVEAIPYAETSNQYGTTVSIAS